MTEPFLLLRLLKISGESMMTPDVAAGRSRLDSAPKTLIHVGLTGVRLVLPTATANKEIGISDRLKSYPSLGDLMNLKRLWRTATYTVTAACLACPATPQQAAPVNPSRAQVKASCQPQLDAASQMQDFNAPRYGGMQMIDATIDSAMHMSDDAILSQINIERQRIASGDYQQAAYSSALACFYTHIIDHRESQSANLPARTYVSVCERNREKIIETLRDRGLSAYAATYDLFNIDMNEKWIQLYQGCAAHDSMIRNYEEFTRKTVADARQHCAGPHNPQLECTQWGVARADDNRRYYEAFVVEFNKALSDPGYSSELGPLEPTVGANAPPRATTPPPPKPVAQAPASPTPPVADPRAESERRYQQALEAMGRPAMDALDALLRPGAPSASSPRPEIDYASLKKGGPASRQSQQDATAAKEAFAKAKQRLVHNRENDATPCVKVEPTGVRAEWGMEGRFRIRNTCDFPIEASWCANTDECSRGAGSTWTLKPYGEWPIFFAETGYTRIEVGACRAGDAKFPPRSTEEIARAGGLNEQHLQPMPYPGLSTMPGHRCE